MQGCRSRGQPVGRVPGAAGAAAGLGSARPLGAARPRPAAAAVPLPGQGQAERGEGGGRPEPARRDRPRPLLPAGEALKHPGEARSPHSGAPTHGQRRLPSREPPLRCSHAGHREAVGVGADFRPVAAGLPGHAGRGVPLQTGQPRRGRPRRGHGQILLGSEALHQPHHQAEIWKEIKPRYTDLRPLAEGKHRKYS